MSPQRIVHPIWSPADTRDLVAQVARHDAVLAARGIKANGGNLECGPVRHKPASTPRPRRDRLGVKATLALVAFGGLVGAAITLAATAKADTADLYTVRNAGAICSTLDSYPTGAGVAGIVTVVLRDGFTPDETARIVVNAVLGKCPYHIPAVDAFIDAYTPGQVA